MESHKLTHRRRIYDQHFYIRKSNFRFYRIQSGHVTFYIYNISIQFDAMQNNDHTLFDVIFNTTHDTT